MLLAAQSSTRVDPSLLNPYRRRRSTGLMRPVELYAMADALAERNAKLGVD
jgi:hypothetical protein